MRLWLKKILHEGSGSNRASTFLCKLSGDGGIESDLDFNGRGRPRGLVLRDAALLFK